DDREGAILEAVRLTGDHGDMAAVRVLAELYDPLTASVRRSVIWSHKPPPQPTPAALFEGRRPLRIRSRKVARERRAMIGLAGLLALGLLALAIYVGTHIDPYYVLH